MYEMKEEYLTGIKQIDDEHRRLFEIADEVYELQHNDTLHDKYDEISQVLNELFDYTKTHFEHEEAYMESIGYKRMFTQKTQHKEFCDRIEQMKIDHLDETSDDLVSEILDFLTKWLIDHILYNDKLIAEG